MTNQPLLMDGESPLQRHFRFPSGTDTERVALHQGVKLIRGKVVGIDRVEKFVHLQDGTRACYDLLILTPGREYYVPMPLAIASVDRFGEREDGEEEKEEE